MVDEIEFTENGIHYKGKAVWGGGCTACGFHIDVEEPVKKTSKPVKYYSTHEGKQYKESLEELYRKVILETCEIE